MLLVPLLEPFGPHVAARAASRYDAPVNRRRLLALLALAPLGGLVSSAVRGQGATPFAAGNVPTAERPGAVYLGQKACEGCHADHAARYRDAAMGHAAERTAECAVLASHPLMTFESGRYRWRIERSGQQTLYSVTDGEATLSAPVAWCIGQGKAGQTWVFERDGVFHESRISYFTKIDGLAFTMGAPPGTPSSLGEAMGRPMDKSDTRACFGCHTTFSAKGSALQVPNALPGVTCEGCHGPGGDHIAALGRGVAHDRGILNPGHLPTEEQLSFCGKCHRSWEDVMLQGIRGIANVRFQPYRLANSKCYDTEDPRISCVACHDPHSLRKTAARDYDAACLACHGNTKTAERRPAPACPKGRSECSSCHMPRYEVPGSHFESTDHMIRIVRPGAPYPN